MMATLKVTAILPKGRDEGNDEITKKCITITKRDINTSNYSSVEATLNNKCDTYLTWKYSKNAEAISKRSSESKDEIAYVPAINLHDAENYQQILNDIKQHVKKQFTTKLTGSSIKIMLTDLNDFDRLTAFYKKKNFSFHICRCNNGKNLSFAIKGVPHSLSLAEVQTRLGKQYPVIRIDRIFSKINRRPTSTCYVEVTNSKAGRKILKMEHLFHTQVTVELWKSDKAIPCKNCQKYSVQKISTTACTKCKGNHSYLLCPLRKTRLSTQSDKCSFCEGYHSYKNCPDYDLLSNNNEHKTNDFHADIAPKHPGVNHFSINEETKSEEKVHRINRGLINCNGNNKHPIIISNEILIVVILFLIGIYCLCSYAK